MTFSVVTKRGDKGMTDVFGQGNVPKDAPRIHAYGDTDELNAILGILLAEPLPDPPQSIIEHIQHTLFRVGADLATPASISLENIRRIRIQDIEYLEQQIKNTESLLSPQTCFLLPKGSRSIGLLHLARAVCRRAERWTVSVSRTESVNPTLLIYLNRLSDYLFVTARSMSKHSGVPEEKVDYS